MLQKQIQMVTYYQQSIEYLLAFKGNKQNTQIYQEMQLNTRLQNSEKQLKFVSSKSYLDSIEGTIGSHCFADENK